MSMEATRLEVSCEECRTPIEIKDALCAPCEQKLNGTVSGEFVNGDQEYSGHGHCCICCEVEWDCFDIDCSSPCETECGGCAGGEHKRTNGYLDGTIGAETR